MSHFIVEEMETEKIEWLVTGGTRMEVKCKQIFPLANFEHLFGTVTSLAISRMSHFVSKFSLLNY